LRLELEQHHSTAVKTIRNPDVVAVFAAYPAKTRAKLMFLRRLIFDVATETQGVGPLVETLKWGQPGYVTSESGSGSTIRIDRVKSRDGRYAMYFHCQTTLVDTFREIYRDEFGYEGNRGIVFHENDEIPVQELSHCISLALTYHLGRKRRSA
jgi:hypothetical protein